MAISNAEYHILHSLASRDDRGRTWHFQEPRILEGKTLRDRLFFGPTCHLEGSLRLAGDRDGESFLLEGLAVVTILVTLTSQLSPHQTSRDGALQLCVLSIKNSPTHQSVVGNVGFPGDSIREIGEGLPTLLSFKNVCFPNLFL